MSKQFSQWLGIVRIWNSIWIIMPILIMVQCTYIYIYTDKYQVYGNVYDCSIAYGVWYMVYGNVS